MSSAHETNLFAQQGGLYQLYPLYLSLRQLLPGRRVLELDCGDGEGAALLADGLAEEVVGVDPDAQMIEAAALRHRFPQLTFQALKHPEVLPFPDGSFDAVLALRRPFDPFRGALLREIARVLSPDGVLVVLLPNPARSALPVPGTSAALDSVPITAHQLGLELRRTFADVQLRAQSPLLGFLFHALAEPEAALGPVELDPYLVEGRLEEAYGWLAVCGRSGPVELATTLVRLSFDDLVAVLIEEVEQGLERAGSILGEEARLQGYQAKLEAIHEQSGGDAEEPAPEPALAPSPVLECVSLPMLESVPMLEIVSDPAPGSPSDSDSDSVPAAAPPAGLQQARGVLEQALLGVQQARAEQDLRLRQGEERLRQAEAERAAALVRARSSEDEIRLLRADLDRLALRLAERDALVGAGQQQLAELRCRVEDERTARQQHEEAAERLAEQHAQAEQHRQELGQQLADREQASREALRLLDEQRAGQAELETRLGQAEALRAREEEAAALSQQSLRVQQAAMRELEARLGEVDARRQRLERELQARPDAEQQQELQASLSAAQEQLAAARELESAQQQVLAEREAALRQLGGQLADLEETTQQLEQDYEERDRRASGLGQELEAHRAMVEALEQRLAEREADAERLEAQLAERDDQLEQWQEDTRRAQAELGKLTVHALSAGQAQRELAAQEEQADQLRRKLELADAELQQLRSAAVAPAGTAVLAEPTDGSALEQITREKERLDGELDLARRELDDLRDQLAQEREERQALADEMENGLATRVAEIQNLEQLIALEKDTSTALERHSTSVELLARRQREEIQTLKGAVEDDRGKIVSAQSTVGRLIKVVKSRDRRITALEERLSASLAALQDARAQAAQLEQRQLGGVAQGQATAEQRQQVEYLRREQLRLQQGIAVLEQENVRQREELEVRRAVQDGGRNAGTVETLLQRVLEQRQHREQAAHALKTRLEQVEGSLRGSQARIEQVVGWLNGAFEQVIRLQKMVE